MQWWVMRQLGIMSIDNDSVDGMDLSALPSNLHMLQWRDGRGEIEYMGRPALRTNFVDVTPYAPLFQQFMTRIASVGLTLAQAKTIQNDLIFVLYDSKRQKPFAYTVTAGAFTWDATDGATAAMSLQIIPKLVAGIDAANNSFVSQINLRLPLLNSNDYTMASYFNASIDQSGSYVPEPANASPISAPAGLSAIPWTPIERTTSVNLTLAEMSGLMGGIAGRQQSLNGVRSTKMAEINAMTTVAGVIAYDVTTGWP